MSDLPMRAHRRVRCAGRGDVGVENPPASGADMTDRCMREATVVRGGGFGARFPPLPDCLRAIAPNRPGANAGANSSLKQALLSGVDGTRTRVFEPLETPCSEAFPESADDLPVRNLPELASIGVQSRLLTSGGSEPSDAELTGGILDALRAGMHDLARTLGETLADRQRARLPANVVAIHSRHLTTRPNG